MIGVLKVGLRLLALLLGGLVGSRTGWLLGEAYVTWTGTSCFEGYCGYAVGLWMMVGLALGVVVGAFLGGRLRRLPLLVHLDEWWRRCP
jgi:predicted ABC-type sugar transport system permease subunit